MSPEIGFVLFLTLLWGPTALWLGYRALRGHRSRRTGSFNVTSDAAQSPVTGPGVTDVLLDQGFWVCGTCRSVNRREAKRCYGCKKALESAGQPAPVAQPARSMVPVMAESVTVPAGGAAKTPAPVATMASAASMAPVATMASAASMAPVATMAPVAATAPVATMAPVAATAPVATTAPAATLGGDSSGPAANAAHPDLVLATAVRDTPMGVPVCPFLGFKNDPSTRCDYADPRNFCHAASARGSSEASTRRRIPGKPGSSRPRELGASQQTSLCLTPAHDQCERYPAAQAGAAK
jgi:hypothetical protein